jgi:flagellar biosynthetic protein FlhB
MKSLRMSKQELKDEYKQQEGDPHIKHKLKQIRAQRARSRMMAAVPKADVVITNPTHYAVALQYEPVTMKAPILIAKGTDTAALRIREVAQEHKIPVLRNPVLARALYADVELDRAVPAEHYRAVAQIISYVFRLKGKTLAPATPASNVIAPKKKSPPTGKEPPKPAAPTKKKKKPKPG